MGKGDKRRPRDKSVSRDQYESNWARAFGRGREPESKPVEAAAGMKINRRLTCPKN